MASNRAVLPNRGLQAKNPSHYGDLEVVRVDVKKMTAEFCVRTADNLVGPSFITRLSTIKPLSEEDTDQLWKMLVKNLMDVLKEEGKYPDFVKGYEVKTDYDSTGEHALYVKILVKPTKGIASDATVDKWNEFLHLVGDALIGLWLQRWPYVQLGEWRTNR